MKNLIIFAILLAFVSCGRIDDNHNIQIKNNDSTIYELVKFILTEHDSGIGHISGPISQELRALRISENELKSLSDLDILSNEEIQNICEMQKDTATLILNKQDIQNFVIIPSDTLLAMQIAYFSMSKPIVSQDKLYGIIDIDFNCLGTCGHGGKYLFKKVGTKWQRVNTLSQWIN